MPYAAINNAQIYYETAGAGEAVVFIHAGIADSRLWQPQVNAFAEKYRVITYDMRGYGRSQPVEGEFSPTDDLRGLLDHVGGDRCALIGCSFGGSVALDFTLQWPARVKALVMVASRPFGVPMDAESRAAIEALEESAGDDLEAANRGEINNWVVGVGRSADQVSPEVIDLALTMNRQALTFENMELGTTRPPYFPDAAGHLSRIRQPVLIVYGDHDRAYVPTAADHMAANIPNARQALMTGTAHLPSLEQPAVFNALVLDFLAASL